MCGIAGIISNKETVFNVNQFNTLGILNDERGGDSCGIFIDKYFKYGVKDLKLFRNFTTTVKYPNKFKIAMLHCRKASAGYAINIEQAQPVIITNNDNIEFVLMHNGTITNINALADKYIPQIEIKGQSDSQILAQIIYYKGYDVLEEYRGTAALAMIDYRGRTPEVLFFKGKSCYNETNSECERPLYYMVDQDCFYFSSMYHSLYNINYKKIIYEFPTNTLLRLNNNKLIQVKKFDRTKLTSYTFPTYTYTSCNYCGDYITFHFSDGLYYIEDVPAHGSYIVYPGGYIVKYPSASSSNTSELYFFKGRLLYNKECFQFLESLTELFDLDFLNKQCPEIIDYFSYTPFIDDNKAYAVNESFQYAPLTKGEFVNLFMSSKKFTISQTGVTIRDIYPTVAIKEFAKDVKNVYFNFTSLEEEALKFISSRVIEVDNEKTNK